MPSSRSRRAATCSGRWPRRAAAIRREGQNTNEPAIRSSLLTGEDLFLILDGVSAQGEAAVKVLVNPLVNLIWLSGFIFVAGCLIAAWPDGRETKRLQKRYAEEPVAGEV